MASCAKTPSSIPCICNASTFEGDLRGQTTFSLKIWGSETNMRFNGVMMEAACGADMLAGEQVFGSSEADVSAKPAIGIQAVSKEFNESSIT